MALSTAERYQIHSAIVSNVFPSKNVELGGTIFTFTFTPEPIPTDVVAVAAFFTPLISIRGVQSAELLEVLPVPLFTLLFTEYLVFHERLTVELAGMLFDYVETAESANTWDVFKNAGLLHAITLPSTNKLSPLQYLWVLHNVRRDSKDKYNLISSVVDALKPWMNLDLYKALKDKDSSTRENYMFDDPNLDEDLQRQAETILKEKEAADLDIIEIEGDEDGG